MTGQQRNCKLGILGDVTVIVIAQCPILSYFVHPGNPSEWWIHNSMASTEDTPRPIDVRMCVVVLATC